MLRIASAAGGDRVADPPGRTPPRHRPAPARRAAMLVAGGLLGLLAACAPRLENPVVVADRLAPQTVSIADTPAPLALHAVDVLVPTGAVVGIETGWAFCAPPYREMPAAAVRAVVAEAPFAALAAEVLEPAGYVLAGPAAAPGVRLPDDPPARLLLAGRVVDLGLLLCREVRYDLGFGPPSDRARGEASLTVRWEMLDAWDRRVVYRGESLGFARLADHRAQGARLLVDLAFQAAVINLAADPAFHRAVVEAGREQALAVRALAAGRPGIPALDPAAGSMPPLVIETAAEGGGRQPIDAAVRATVRIERADRHGSGVVIAPAGYVLTADHVAGGGGTRRVVLADGTTLSAAVIRRDPRRDVALLRLPERPLPYPSVAIRPDTPAAAETVYAVTAPPGPGSGGTVAPGTIRAIRHVPEIDRGRQRVIQADVAVRAGSSGGPLLDTRGRLVGLTRSAPPGPAGGAAPGPGYFVPIDDALAALNLRAVPPGSLPPAGR